MASIKGTNVVAPVVPSDTADVHPSHEAQYGKGGYRTVASTAERDAIPAPRREAGMLVYVVADQKIYTLAANLTTWSELSLGGVSSWNDLADKPSTFPPASHNHDDRYYTEAEIDTLLAGKQAAGSYAATVHQHTIADVTGLQTALNAKATPADISTAVASLVNAAPATLDTLKELADALGSDAAFSTTVTNALAAKAPIASPTFTGTVSGITKSMVGLGNVDNTSDAAKPVSTATQTALDGKAASSHTHATLVDLSLTGDTTFVGLFGGEIETNKITLVTPSGSSPASITFADTSVQTTAWTGSVASSGVAFAATDRLLGRSSAGAGAGQEIVCTAAGRSILALSLGTAGQVLKVNAGATGVEWGLAESDVRSDTVSSTTYTGRAAPGSATSATVWKIRRTIYTSAGAVSSTATATNVRWNDRLTASYS